MEIDYAFLADAAETSSDGKLYALGAGVNVIRGQSFPVVHPHLSFVVKLKLHATECEREHGLDVVLWDTDGQDIGRFHANFGAARQAGHPTRPAFVQLVFNFVNLRFPGAGDYAFHVIVDGQHLKEVPVYVEAVAAPQSPTQEVSA